MTVRSEGGSESYERWFTLTPVNDAVDEEDETVTVGGSATGLTVTGDARTTTRGGGGESDVTVPEGGSAYTVVLRSSPTGPVTVTLDVRVAGT